MPQATREDTRYSLTDAEAWELAAKFGTPLYVLDENTLRAKIQRYRSAMLKAWPKTEITFASKANSTLAVLKIAYDEGCLIDAASEGELRAAMLAGVPATQCHLHGNNKSLDELKFAFEAGVGQIVVDNIAEIESISEISNLVGHAPVPHLILRLAPGVDPKTHHKISTGQADTKFGFNIADGSAERALLRCVELGLPVKGFHCHVGSQLFDPEAQSVGGEALAEFASEMLRKHGFHAKEINLGGGLGVRYTEDDPLPMPVEDYCDLVARSVGGGIENSGLEVRLTQEPGRSLVAEAGVTLYRVGVVKTVPAAQGLTRTYVVVDGGLSDNPRPALYGSRYTAQLIGSHKTQSQGMSFLETEAVKVTIAGKHCESDTLFADVILPHMPAEGDLIQIFCTGAYNSSMASNYNRYPRPATVLRDPTGHFRIVQRRDSWQEMFSREILANGQDA